MRASESHRCCVQGTQSRVLGRGGSCCRCRDGDEGIYGKVVVKTTTDELDYNETAILVRDEH